MGILKYIITEDMDISTIKKICDKYKWGKSIDALSDEYMIPIEAITRVLEINGLLKEYEDDDKPKGQLMKSIDVIVAYCPECGNMVELSYSYEKRMSPNGNEEWLCYCDQCDCEFWAYENYGIDKRHLEREKRREELSKLSKEELINMLVNKI